MKERTLLVTISSIAERVVEGRQRSIPSTEPHQQESNPLPEAFESIANAFGCSIHLI
jgi:hypothetical protein